VSSVSWSFLRHAELFTDDLVDFIRDPDDPTFHPVRDVLERNIVTQLRKIAFSALVYGALVIVCLGGVVWGLSFAFQGVLPIHWSSNVPVLEFPVDLLFYNFVMPFAIRSLRPSDGLHTMYDWWFHKCARMLRLSEFLFGERHRDEEGRHVRRTWRDLFSGKRGDPEHPVVGEEQKMMAEKEGSGVYFLSDGRYVRAPASDQVRIPKGSQVFLEVTEENERVDGAADPDDGLHGRTSDMFTKVYIPPFFRLRIAAFIFTIWIFAAITGVGVTVVPLVVGRRLISSFFPSPVRVNDIYAFSAGIYAVGGAAYALLYCRTGYFMLKERLRPVFACPRQVVLGAWEVALQAARVIYVSTAFALFVPSLFALLTELYLLVPLHTYMEDQQTHVIHFIQDWTLGVLYVQMAIKFIQWRSTSRPAIALNAITRDGWLQPNASLATRAFILPISVLALCAMILPLCLGFIANTILFHHAAGVLHSQVYRYSYPASFMVGLVIWFVYLLRRQVEKWRAHIRDDVYLIGERLHNFGEKRARDVTAVRRRMITS
jgi:E3 ubiquitin-protein ligase MARCH6